MCICISKRDQAEHAPFGLGRAWLAIFGLEVSNESLVESIFRKDPCTASASSLSKQDQLLQQQAAKP